MQTLEVLNPSGSINTADASQYAPRLPTLRGRTICEVSNGSWEARRTFPVIRELLKKRFPDIKIVPYSELPEGVWQIDIPDMGERLKTKGCEAAIGGNSG